MQIRVLGPVEVQAGSGQVLTAPRRLERCLLAILALEAGRTVLMDRLRDLLWDDADPVNPRRVVHTYVARLRALLARAGAAEHGVALVSDRGGYVLRIDPDLVDAHRFRRLVGQATDATDLTARDRLLTEALGLWRGPALEGAAGDRLGQRLCADLDELRLHALDESIATRIDLGRYRELLPELSKLVVEHPTRQRLVELHMRALYQDGRPAEALAAYTELRARLADELGIDPNAALQQLHQAILRGLPVTGGASAGRGPAGRTSAAAGTAPEVTPAQLPADLPAFAGRQEPLNWLDGMLQSRTTAVVISAIAGTAGVGKTTLAVHWAHTVRDRFPDGQLYVNLRGFDPHNNAATPAEVVRRFLDALNVPARRIPPDFGAQVNLYRSLMAGRRVLVILDNARDPDQVRPLLPGTDGCLTVITSRNQLTGLVAIDGARPIALDLLSTEEARRLLAARLGAERLAAEPDAVDELIALCARLPLALAIAAAHVETRPRLTLTEFVVQLRGRPYRLDALTGDDTATDIRAIFACSYQALSPAAARLFRLLGRHPGPDISAPAAASLAGVPPAEVGPLLAELRAAHLVAEQGTGRFAMHDLLREYAGERAETDESEVDRRAALRRVLDHYTYTGLRAELLLAPEREPIELEPASPGVTPERLADAAEATAWFTAEHSVLLAALHRAGVEGFDGHVWRMAWVIATFLDRRGHAQDRVTAQLAAIAATQRLGDPGIEARAHRGLAIGYYRLNRLDEARERSEHSLAMTRTLGDRRGQAESHRLLCSIEEEFGRYEASLHHARACLEIFRELGDVAGVAGALNSVGWCLGLLGDYAECARICEEALELMRGMSSRLLMAGTLHSLGNAYNQLGQQDKAIATFRECVARTRELGDRFYEAQALIGLGDASRDAGDPAGARAAWQEARDILERLNHPMAEAVRAKLTA